MRAALQVMMGNIPLPAAVAGCEAPLGTARQLSLLSSLLGSLSG